MNIEMNVRSSFSLTLEGEMYDVSNLHRGSLAGEIYDVSNLLHPRRPGRPSSLYPQVDKIAFFPDEVLDQQTSSFKPYYQRRNSSSVAVPESTSVGEELSSEEQQQEPPESEQPLQESSSEYSSHLAAVMEVDPLIGMMIDCIPTPEMPTENGSGQNPLEESSSENSSRLAATARPIPAPHNPEETSFPPPSLYSKLWKIGFPRKQKVVLPSNRNASKKWTLLRTTRKQLGAMS